MPSLANNGRIRPRRSGTIFWRRVRNSFITGLIIVAPVAITLYILVSLFNFFDGFLGQSLSKLIWTLFGLDHYAVLGRRIPGVGAIVTVILLVVTGALATNLFGRRLIDWGDQLLDRLPIVRSIYGTTKQITESLLTANKGAFKQVALVQYPRVGIWTIGFVTSEGMPQVEQAVGSSEHMLSIFVATVPNPTSGFVLLLPKSEVIILDIPVEDGLKYVISGGVITPAARPLNGGRTDERTRGGKR